MAWLTRRRAGWLFVAMAAATLLALVILGRHGTFRQDEWAFIGFQPAGIELWLRPHNEHWSTVPRLLYGAILAVVGLHSYLPYLAALATLHVLAAGGVHVLLARRLSPTTALLAAVPVLAIGSGYENLLWAFQVGFVGAVAFGIWALVALEGGRRGAGPVGAALLVLSLASAGMGLFFLLAALIRLVVDPTLRHRLVWLAIPALLYGVWHLAYGQGALASVTADPVTVAWFAIRGLAYTAGRFLGLDLAGRAPLAGRVLGAVALGTGAIALGWLAWRAWGGWRPARHRVASQPAGDLAVPATGGAGAAAMRSTGAPRAPVPALALAGFAAAAATYVVVGLARAGMPDDFTTRSRYVYVAAFLLVPAAADLACGLSAALTARRRQRRPAPWAVGPLAGGLLALSVGANLVDLHAGRAEILADAGLVRAKLTIVAQHHDAPWLDPAGLPYEWNYLLPLDAIVARYGWPLRDTLIPSDTPPPTPDELDRALVGLAVRGFVVAAATGAGSGRSAATVVVAEQSVRSAPDGACLRVSAAAAGASVTLQVTGGDRLELDLRGASLLAELGHSRPPTAAYRATLPPTTQGTTGLTVPDLGDGSTWQVRLLLAHDAGEVRVCTWTP